MRDPHQALAAIEPNDEQRIITLCERQIHTFTCRRPPFVRGPTMRLLCVSGRLWVTIDGDKKDYILSAGEYVEVTRGRVVLVALRASALRASALRLSTRCGRTQSGGGE